MKAPKEKTFNHGGHDKSKDNEKIINQALFAAKKPLTRRQLNQITSIEICTLCLPLLRLIKAGTLYIAYRCPCPITGNKCYHYALSSWKGAVNA
jgi:hypothetical protein